MKLLKKYPVLILFTTFILFFSITDILTPDRDFSEIENTFLAKAPRFSISALFDSGKNGFSQQYEKYTNEQFFLRDRWITLKSISESVLLKVENNGIVYGEDGYLFDRFTSYDKERYARNVGLLENFAQQHPQIPKTLLIAPSAYAVLPEKLPIGLKNVDQSVEIPALVQRLSQSGWNSVDIATPLQKEAQTNDALYYKTDHHWTTQGAYLAYSAYAAAQGRPIAPFAPQTASTDFLGTHFSKCKYFLAKPETMLYDPTLPVDSVTIDGTVKEGFYDLSKLETRDKYAMFLWGNNGVTILENSKAPEGTLLVLKDSFANSMLPFLSQSYARIVVVDLRSLPQTLSEVLAREKPDEILLLYNFKNLISDTDLPRIKY